MPGQERKRKKPTYRVTNCHEYNQSLKKRGQISIYFPDGDLLSQFIDASPYTRGVSGRTSSYRAPYVELIGCVAISMRYDVRDNLKA